MTSADFAEFYKQVHDRPPFPWQERLAGRLLNGDGWPQAVAIPTACGKTSVIDAAVFALAAQAHRPVGERTAPLRIFFVVDRRLVVDDVSRHAEKLAKAIEGSEAEGVARVRERLRQFGGAKALAVATLRGGMYRSDSWADAPNQPLVCVSTVDQVGSRLLFRGYGVSDSVRPVHAGLAGTDSLIILDEAHLSQPFHDTIDRVTRYQAWAREGIALPLRVVMMSATVRDATNAFGLEAEDYASALKKRLQARKIAELKEAANLERVAAEEAMRLAEAGAGVIGVVLNTVASARATFESLRESGEKDSILLTGRVRPYDRDRLVAAQLDRIKTGRTRKADERLFVVATQTAEVGADLDFDALVTEAAPLDALRQRFGRLDRIGERQSTQAVILKPKRSKDRAWIYGEALESAWEWLNEQASDEHGRKVIDFGVRRMQDLYERKGNASLDTARENGPLMFPAHVDAWAQTSPSPAADPDVAPFLHGGKALQAADVQIVWRADLPERENEWLDAVAAAPPVSTEALPLPIGLARRWLKGELGQAADIEGISDEPNGDERGGAQRDFLIWRGPESSVGGRLGDLRPGDTIVVRSEEGGCDEFGWDPDAGRVQDIGDLCANERARSALGRFRVRLHPWVLFPDSNDAQNRTELTAWLKAAADDDEEALEKLEQLRDQVAGEQKWPRAAEEYGDGWLVWTSHWPKRTEQEPRSGVTADETDEDESGSLTHAVELPVHTDGVRRRTKLFAEKCGLVGAAAEAVELAARFHDLGKWDDRFQMLLDPYRSPALEPLAKGEPAGSAAEFRRRRQLAGYPKCARHEFASVALVEAFPGWPEGCDRELALYLIGTHHGRGRPFPPVWEEDPNHTIRAQIDGQTIAVQGVERIAYLGSGWVDRFWMLTRKYGWWGLAYLEAVLRRADCVRSREEREGKE